MWEHKHLHKKLSGTFWELMTLSGESDQDTVATPNDNAYMRFPGQMRVNSDTQDFDAVRRFKGSVPPSNEFT